jgi:hypothetical protein
MPYEDLNAYQSFCKELLADLAPETRLERQYAQTFCDTQWRLNRALSIEDGILALGHFEPAGAIDAGHPEIHAALTAARVFREHSKAFVNLSLYEQRLQRTLKESLRQLQELQANRIAARQAELDPAVAQCNLLKMKGQASDASPQSDAKQFVFSPAEVEAEASRQSRRTDAEQAKKSGYDLEKYQAFSLKQAA